MSYYIFCLFQSIPSTQEETSYFRLIKIDEDALFVEEEEFQNNRRFTLLHMREQGVRILLSIISLYYGTLKVVLIKQYINMKLEFIHVHTCFTCTYRCVHFTCTCTLLLCY